MFPQPVLKNGIYLLFDSWTIFRNKQVSNGPNIEVRVVFVKLPQDIFKRGLSKVCFLSFL